MTKHGSFKKAVRRHARDTDQRYTEALADLEGVGERMFHEPIADHLLAHLRDHHRIDATAATPVSRHNDHVFRIDRGDGDPWIARVFPPARPKENVEGDAGILRFLERQGYPAERPATEDPVSTFDGSSVLVTKFIDGHLLPSPAVGAEGAEKFKIMGDLLGRLHALPLDESVTRLGGASGEDPSHEGAPRQDLLAALSFLDAVDTKVAPETREHFDQLRAQVASADDAQGLPESLVHGNLMHAPDHVIVTDRAPIAIQWKGSGRGPRLADFAYLMWGTWLNPEWIAAAATAYRQHIELTTEELDRLEAVMHIRPLYLAAFDWRRSLESGRQPTSSDTWWHQPDPNYIAEAAAATRSALG
jgi:Ser/Thr protein kinase RdoA (MazF antagonist)